MKLPIKEILIFFAFICLIVISVIVNSITAKAKEQERTRIEKANWKYLELTEE